MALLPEEREENIIRSLINHVETNYTLTTKYFQWSDVTDTQNANAWVVFYKLPSTRTFIRNYRPDRHGNLVNMIYAAHIHVKPTDEITKIHSIRDAVFDVLNTALIQVKDYVSGSQANLGKIRSNGLVLDSPQNRVDDLDQYVIAFSLQYIEEFQRA